MRTTVRIPYVHKKVIAYRLSPYQSRLRLRGRRHARGGVWGATAAGPSGTPTGPMDTTGWYEVEAGSASRPTHVLELQPAFCSAIGADQSRNEGTCGQCG